MLDLYNDILSPNIYSSFLIDYPSNIAALRFKCIYDYTITIYGRTAKLSQCFSPVLQIVDVKHK